MNKTIIHKIIIVIAIIITLILLIPVVRVGLHNYATGDDYKFSIYTYQGLQNQGVIGAIKGSFQMVKEIYETWQGTWFTIFLFSLAPQNLGDRMYIATVFISLAALFYAEYIIIKRYVYTQYRFSLVSFVTLIFMVFNISVQYMPRTTSGIFWFNGIMHYTIPLLIAMGCISSTNVILRANNNEDKNKSMIRKTLVILGLTALGGSNYLAAIIGLFGVGYQIFIEIIDGLREKRISFRKCFIFLIGLFLEFVGLYISYKSPGNDIRSFDDMSFRPRYFVQCIWWSIDRSRTDIIKYCSEKEILIIFIIAVVVITAIEIIRKIQFEKKYIALVKHPIYALLFVNGAHMASYMPEVYAHSDYSGGVPNTHFQMLLLIIIADIIIIGDLVARYFCWKRLNVNISYHRERIINTWIIAISILAIVSTVFCIEEGKSTTTNQYCREYINSGRMAEYEQVRIKQYEICMHSKEKDVIVPEYYDDVYPVCHMTMAIDSTAWFNEERAAYFGLDSIATVDFREY